MTRHFWMMRLYDLVTEIDKFVKEPNDDGLQALWELAIGYKIDIDLELDQGPDTDDSNDGKALASAGFGTDEDYGGTDERA